MFLAGTSAFLSGSRCGGKRARAFPRLARRVLLELTVVNAAWAFNLRFESGVILQAIWAIGASRRRLRGFLHRPDRFGLPVVYAAWIAAVALLHPPFRWFAGVKRRSAWLSSL